MKIVKLNIKEALRKNYMPYVVDVIGNRALPLVYDGLKPSHRKALYTAHKMGITADDKTKSANLVGQTMKLNPHGDSAIYETLVRMCDQNEALLVPLFAGKGNFGKTYSRDMSYAASRYTEIGLSDITKEFFKVIDKNVVEFQPNYDGKIQEPTVLPVNFPNILVNPNLGIAVGMASNICSFNFEEICNATIGLLQGNENVQEFITAPDFPTGGEYIPNHTELKKIITTGKGSIKIRAKYTIDTDNNCIDVHEIPYTTTAEAIVDKIVDLVKTGKIKEVSDVRDETDLQGLKVTIDYKRGTNPEKLIQKLFKLTPLEDGFSCNFNVLYKNENGELYPKVMGVKEILDTWITWRIDCYRNEVVFDYNKIRREYHLLVALEKIALDIDKAIKVIRESEDDDTIIKDLMEYFGIDKIQAEYVANIRLRNLNHKYIIQKTAVKEELEQKLQELDTIINSNEIIKDHLVKQLQRLIKLYGEPRRTTVGEIIETTTRDILIDDYNCTFVFSEQGYLKKNVKYSATQKVKDGDKITQVIAGNNRSTLMFFTNKAQVFFIDAHTIDDCTPSAMGTYIPPMLEMEQDEKIVYMTSTVDYKENLLFIYENGKMAKVPMASFATKTKRKKLANAYSELSPLVQVMTLEKDVDIIVLSSIGKALIINTEETPIKTSRNSQGVNVLASRKGSYLKEVKFVSEAFPDGNEEAVAYYRANRGAVGKNLKKEHDWTQEQMTLI